MAPIRPCETGRQFGFTLTELLVVLAIVGLLIVAAPALVKSALPGMQDLAAARALSDDLRLARGQAVSRSVNVEVRFDDTRQVYVVAAGPEHVLPNRVRFAFASANAARTVLFRPDGSSSGAVILVGTGQKPHRVKADWLTGRVTVDE